MKIVLFHFGRSVVVGKYHFNLHIMIMCGFFSFSFYTYVRVIFFCFSLLTPEGKIWSISDLTRTIFWLYKHIVICCRGSETGWYHQNRHTFLSNQSMTTPDLLLKCFYNLIVRNFRKIISYLSQIAQKQINRSMLFDKL